MRWLWLLLWASSLLAQSNRGELRLSVADPNGLGVKATVQLASEANQYNNSLATGDDGKLNVLRLPYGLYTLPVQGTGFAPVSKTLDIHSSLPLDVSIQLQVAAAKESVTVTEQETLLDPDRAGSVNEIGKEVVQKRLTALPGRSIQ